MNRNGSRKAVPLNIIKASKVSGNRSRSKNKRSTLRPESDMTIIKHEAVQQPIIKKKKKKTSQPDDLTRHEYSTQFKKGSSQQLSKVQKLMKYEKEISMVLNAMARRIQRAWRRFSFFKYMKNRIDSERKRRQTDYRQTTAFNATQTRPSLHFGNLLFHREEGSSSYCSQVTQEGFDRGKYMSCKSNNKSALASQKKLVSLEEIGEEQRRTGRGDAYGSEGSDQLSKKGVVNKLEPSISSQIEERLEKIRQNQKKQAQPLPKSQHKNLVFASQVSSIQVQLTKPKPKASLQTQKVLDIKLWSPPSKRKYEDSFIVDTPDCKYTKMIKKYQSLLESQKLSSILSLEQRYKRDEVGNRSYISERQAIVNRYQQKVASVKRKKTVFKRHWNDLSAVLKNSSFKKDVWFVEDGISINQLSGIGSSRHKEDDKDFFEALSQIQVGIRDTVEQQKKQQIAPVNSQSDVKNSEPRLDMPIKKVVVQLEDILEVQDKNQTESLLIQPIKSNPIIYIEANSSPEKSQSDIGVLAQPIKYAAEDQRLIERRKELQKMFGTFKPLKNDVPLPKQKKLTQVNPDPLKSLVSNSKQNNKQIDTNLLITKVLDYLITQFLQSVQRKFYVNSSIKSLKKNATVLSPIKPPVLAPIVKKSPVPGIDPSIDAVNNWLLQIAHYVLDFHKQSYQHNVYKPNILKPFDFLKSVRLASAAEFCETFSVISLEIFSDFEYYYVKKIKESRQVQKKYQQQFVQILHIYDLALFNALNQALAGELSIGKQVKYTPWLPEEKFKTDALKGEGGAKALLQKAINLVSQWAQVNLGSLQKEFSLDDGQTRYWQSTEDMYAMMEICEIELRSRKAETQLMLLLFECVDKLLIEQVVNDMTNISKNRKSLTN